MADTLAVQHDAAREPEASSSRGASPPNSSMALREVWEMMVRRRRLAIAMVAGLPFLCLIYSLVAPKQYEADAKVAVRTAPASSLALDAAEAYAPVSILSASVQQETLAGVFRSDQLAWRVITDLKLYQSPAFMGRFASKFPGFRPEAPTPAAEAYLLERFAWRLHVQTIPRTLLIDIRFRSRDPLASAAVVNGLIRAYSLEDSESRLQATHQAADWLESQLKDLKTRVASDQERLSQFQQQHGIVSTPETLANGQPGHVEHIAALMEIDELGRQQVAAASDRILREAEYRAASQGNPELVIASDPSLQAEGSGFATAMLQQLHARHSDLELEEAQLRIEHGANFPRVVEIRGQLQDLDRQIKAEDDNLVERFRGAWQMAKDREQLVHENLEQRTSEGMKLNQSAAEYAAMRQEADSSHELYVRILEKVEESGFSAGTHASNIAVIDYAHPPAKPVAPDLPLYMAITVFVALWVALGAVFLVESLSKPVVRKVGTAFLAILVTAAAARGQAPTPSTSGLPAGVAHIAPAPEVKVLPDPKEAPAIWDSSTAGTVGPSPAGAIAGAVMPAPLGPGDLLDVSEFRTPEFHTIVRVSPAGSVILPMVEEVQVRNLDEQAAARAIEAALVAKGMLVHPHVSVMVMAYAGQDVSVLGEVTHPGVYPYTLHHRLLDLLSEASGLSSNAGRLVNIFHRSDPQTPHPVVLDPSGTDTGADHNPEVAPGDTIQVSRAGLVYVIGAVVRPGGFPVDPAQGLTVVHALSLAWGTSPNAATGKALLIREQKGGRTLTTLNLKRLLHGQEPDQPIYDRDILFVPDSTAKNLWNKTLESVIQSAAGVSIYAGLVYSQRF